MKNIVQLEGKVIGVDFNAQEKSKIFNVLSPEEITFVESKKQGSFEELISNKDVYVILIPFRQWVRLSKNGKDKSLKKFYIKKIDGSLIGNRDVLTECVVAISTELFENDEELKNIIDDAKGIYNFISNLKKEISLYKELYFRKAEHLEFLDDFFKSVIYPKSVKEVFEKGFLKIRDYFSVQGISILIPWENNTYKLYVTSNEDFWIKYVEKKLKLKKNLLDIDSLRFDNQENKEADIVDLSPLQENFKVFISLDSNNMGYDDFTVLEMAIDHLCLLIQRGLEYDRLSSFAYMDFLTGVGNRHYFDKIIRQEVKRHERLGSKFSVVMIDIDHFKKINDTFGHAVGDMVLNQLAKIIKENAREIDYIIRYGGEEFLVILPHTDKESAQIFAERLRKRVEEYEFLTDNGQSIKVTISIGISEFDPRSSKNFEEILKFADIALYNSKENGRNRVTIV